MKTLNIITFALITTLFCLTAFQCHASGKQLKVGDKAPDFELQDQDGITHKLSDLQGKKVALYFYPADDTPGCTKEACSIRDSFADLKEAGITILGASKGSIKSKKKFAEKYHLSFPLLAATKKVLKDYGVSGSWWNLYLLPKRHTFLIDENGIIVAIIKKVDAQHHAQQIIDAFENR